MKHVLAEGAVADTPANAPPSKTRAYAPIATRSRFSVAATAAALGADGRREAVGEETVVREGPRWTKEPEGAYVLEPVPER